jgi:hypothetical protein
MHREVRAFCATVSPAAKNVLRCRPDNDRVFPTPGETNGSENMIKTGTGPTYM